METTNIALFCIAAIFLSAALLNYLSSYPFLAIDKIKDENHYQMWMDKRDSRIVYSLIAMIVVLMIIVFINY